ncbi:rhomboid family intramembrane serine protease [Acidiluteibacter ferrifornacis]|uniref:Rhomboid family intramembrane serine protease n=1 Tax=Acidiluteibacter ferrifornacis TaxID=2692424 RepID=A0A6N9NK65_9FLAO|nr:rhomboid family intramembrane serine protease [Acidiluteibacter ferrifornacis]NBG67088.1 rhomboid family intramembrane serine protease [Acidiluteibacter ferrifornacis]
MNKSDKRKFFYAILFPTIFVVVVWFIKVIELNLNLSFAEYGIRPREWSGLIGILLMPFIHGDFNHLFNNSIPLLILGSSLFYFYRPVAFKVLFWSIIMSGLWTWISARDSYHIGASGLVYSLFGFLFVSGFIRKHYRLVAISFLVAFLYGSMIWGIFPIDYKVSYEGHFWGMFAGVVLAYIYREVGLKKVEYVWTNEDERHEDDPDAYWNKPLNSPPTNRYNSPINTEIQKEREVVYHYKPKQE